MIVVADSNALMSFFRLGINMNDALDRALPLWELVVPSSVVLELERLSLTNREARSALALARSGLCRIYGTEGEADDVVIELAREMKGVVFTNDREVLRRTKEAALPRMYFRGGETLAVEGLL
ncbi:MAG: hypothetical protein KAT70_05410 [Thermoplasmata archaeon]|nr:hypothetical protein [Thermoplasmata archaeon]